MKLLNILLILMMMASVGCSSSSDVDDVDSDSIVSNEEDADLEFADDELEEELAEDVDSEATDETTEKVAESQPAEEFEEVEEEAVAFEEAPAESAMQVTKPVVNTDTRDVYKVLDGETYMMISFKLYGDYTRWREVAALNPDVQTLVPGQLINVMKPAKEFVWMPKGLPYLIESGDTLGTISKKKYDTSSRWKDIYDNNRVLIKDPNLIFAGFTLYYIPDTNRGAASFQ